MVRTFSIYDAKQSDWESIIHLADLWGFPEVKALAIRQLSEIQMDTVDRIVLYKRYHVDPTLLVPEYGKLCQREAILTTKESEALGLETAIKIFQAREKLRSRVAFKNEPNGLLKSPLPGDVGHDKVLEVVVALFKLGKS